MKWLRIDLELARVADKAELVAVDAFLYLSRTRGNFDIIFLDPPYNTGNEKWVYNDNVNHPKIKQWLGEVVGQQGEDLSRHDKWLCMMYPRLTLLRKLLAEDGVIFISIDDNEYANLKLLCDEIFGANNLVGTIIWKNKYGAGAKTIGFIGVHEYVLMYSKSNITDISSELSIEMQGAYNKRDKHFEIEAVGIFNSLEAELIVSNLLILLS